MPAIFRKYTCNLLNPLGQIIPMLPKGQVGRKKGGIIT